jgi:putative exosortase-associated protein (TIGR04073 family)
MRLPFVRHRLRRAGAARNANPPARRKLGIGAVVAEVLLAVLLVSACSSVANAQSAGRKFGRGLAAMTTPFLEVPGNMVAETRRRGAAEGIPVGFAIGCGMIVPRVLVGVYEFVTAPFPAPAGYKPILHPEFPWSYFDEPGQSRRAAAGNGTARTQTSRR